MKKWSHEITISAPIEGVWSLFDYSQDQTKKIIPKLISIEPVEQTEELVGSVYRQVFRQRGVVQEHFIKILDYKDTPDYKLLKTNFEIEGMINVTTTYEVKRLSKNKTSFKTEIINEPLRLDMKFMLFFAGKKPAVDFCKQVQLAAEADYQINLNEL